MKTGRRKPTKEVIFHKNPLSSLLVINRTVVTKSGSEPKETEKEAWI